MIRVLTFLGLLLPLGSCGSAVVTSQFAAEVNRAQVADELLGANAPLLLYMESSSQAGSSPVISVGLVLVRQAMRAELTAHGVQLTESESDANSAIWLKQSVRDHEWTTWQHEHRGDTTYSTPIENRSTTIRYLARLYVRNADEPAWTGVAEFGDSVPNRAFEEVGTELARMLLGGEQVPTKSIRF